MNTTFKPIGYLESPFKEKFGIPRQAGLAPEARAVVRLDPAMRDGLQGLEGFSHVWILFVFHGHENDDGKLLVRPPRLGGTRKMGVFATRSPHRPNPIGLSLVRLEGVEPDESSPAIHVSGVDFLDGTPVLDIKPYLPGGDIARGEVRTGWLEKAPEWPALEVTFSEEARTFVRRVSKEGYPDLEALITRILGLDPRPAFQRDDDARYAARVMDFDVHWEMQGTRCRVIEIRDLRTP